MKATVDIPDDLYRRVKAKSALEGIGSDSTAFPTVSFNESESVPTQTLDTLAHSDSWTR